MPTDTPTPPPFHGDVNGDGQVDADDLSVLIGGLFEPQPPVAGDVNADGTLTSADVPALIGLNWSNETQAACPVQGPAACVAN
jgi:hypothetical protein